MHNPLYSTLLSIHGKLIEFDLNLVLGESCTAGLVAAELAQVPGISAHLCGSMVVYQNQSKTAWLGLDPKALADPTIGPVSMWASTQLAERLLVATPHASLSAAITGHLGPDAPPELDGVIFLAAQYRVGRLRFSKRIKLVEPAPAHSRDLKARRGRQQEAAHYFLSWIDEIVLQMKLPSDTPKSETG